MRREEGREPQSATERALHSLMIHQAEALEGIAEEMARWFAGDEIHWVHGDPEGEGSDYCSDCAEERAAEAREGKSEEDAEDIFPDGGWDCDARSDHVADCERCGRKLRYTLTEYAYSEEASHHASHPVAWALPPSPDTAYDMSRLLAAAASDLRYGETPSLGNAQVAIETARTALGILPDGWDEPLREAA